MSHRETPQKRERQQKLELLALSPSPLSLLPLSISPFGNKHQKGLILLGWSIWWRGRDSLRSLDHEGRSVLVRLDPGPIRRGRSRICLWWRRWRRTHLGAWSRSPSDLGTLNRWIGGDRCGDLLGGDVEVLITLIQTLSPRSAQDPKRWRQPWTR
jgi:hypothetical protein